MLLEISRLKISFYFKGYARAHVSKLHRKVINAGLIYSWLTTLPSSTRSSSSSLSVELSAWAVGILETVDRLCRFCLLFWLYLKRNNIIRAVRILNVRLNIPWVQPVIKINSTFIDISLLELFTVWIWGFTEESSRWRLFWLYTCSFRYFVNLSPRGHQRTPPPLPHLPFSASMVFILEH